MVNGNLGGGEGSPGGGPQVPSLPPKFKGYCLFCLKHLKDSSFLNYVKKNPRKVKYFQPVLSYLTGGKDQGVSFPRMEKLSGMMCQPCYEVMADIYHLHKQLIKIQHLIQKQTLMARMKVLRAIIPEGYDEDDDEEEEDDAGGLSPWSKFGMEVMDEDVTGLSRVEANKAKQFVKSLHHLILSEGTKSVNIPLVLPTDLMPTRLEDFVSTSIEVESESPQELKVEKQEEMETEQCLSEPELDFHLDFGKDSNMEFDPLAIDDNDEEEDDSDYEEETNKTPKSSSWSKLQASGGPSRKRLKKGESIRRFVNGKVNVQVCDLCGELTLLTEIVSHLESHVKDYVTLCPNSSCGYAFSSLLRMEYHLGSSKKCRIAANLPATLEKGRSRYYICNHCRFETANMIAFKTHLNVHEHELGGGEAGGGAFFPCPIPNCDQRFSLRQSVEIHLNKHNLRPPKPFQRCTGFVGCSAKIHVDKRSAHLKQVHGVPLKSQHFCKHCKFVFPDKPSLIRHLSYHGEEAWTCDVCGEESERFPKHVLLVKHYVEVHQIGEQYPCPTCDKVFFHHRSMLDHQKLIHSTEGGPPKKGKNYKCDLCSENFISTTDVFAHKIKMHGAPHFSCKMCERTFTRQYLLIKHERQIHSEQEWADPLKCDVPNCDKFFRHNKALEHHKLVKHPSPLGDPSATSSSSVGGVAAHRCDICGVSYELGSSLQSHMKSAHRQSGRPFCETCGETFTTNTSLRNHRLIHTGERPHSCEICGQGFRQRSAMKTHLKGHELKGDSFQRKGEMRSAKRRR